MRRRASLIRLALKPPARPRLEVSRIIAAREGPPLAGGAGRRSSGKRSASSAVYRSAMTSRRACAYGRAATTRSWARLSFDVATSSIVLVIFRVFWTDRIRPLSWRLLAITREPSFGGEERLERGDCGLEPAGQIVVQALLGLDIGEDGGVRGLEVGQEV